MPSDLHTDSRSRILTRLRERSHFSSNPALPRFSLTIYNNPKSRNKKHVPKETKITQEQEGTNQPTFESDLGINKERSP